jgi:hypothetical protein
VTNTTEEGINVNPSLSGDGQHIAFESTEDLAHAGGSDHFRALRADLASDPANFTQLGGTRSPAPGISQDGSRIAFAAKEDPLGTNPDGNSEIFYYDGTTLRQITNTTPADPSTRTRDGNFQPSLTDDGRFIAFASNRNLASQNADGNLEIFIFDTNTNTFTQLTNTSGTVGATDAKISGDGTRVAYIRDNGTTASAQRDLILQDRIGGTTRVLASNVTNIAFTYGRAISDDGSRVVYAADIATDSSQVFLFDGRTSNSVRQVTALGVRTTEVPLHPTISGDGTRLAFATRRPIAGFSNTDNSIELYTFDIPTGQFARVTNAPSTADGFSGSTRQAEVVSSLNDDGSIVAFNFPRVLSGAVTSGLENNSEIYVTATAARPTVGALTVLNGASFGNEPSTTKAIAPNSIAVALGGALSFTTVQAQKQADGSFPTTLGGTTVTVNNRAAQILFVSPTQVNFLVPAQTEIGTATVVVTNSEGFQSRGTVSVLRAAPGIFTISGDGKGEARVLNADTLQTGPFDPSGGNLRLIIFTTGVRAASQVTATAGGRALTVESFIASPDMAGLDEVHVLVPSDLRGAGTVDLVVSADGRASNPATIIFTGDARRDIIINEVLASPPAGAAGDANHDGVRDSSDDEFVELVNTTSSDIDISGFQLLTRSTSSSSDTVRHTFAPGTIFPAGTAIVVFGGGNPNPSDPVFGGAQIFKASSGGLSLTNSGGVVTLRDASQAIVNIFSYGGSTGLNGDNGQSLTRSPDITGNFVQHTAATGSGGRIFSPGTRVDGTPFAGNPIARIDVTPSSATIDAGAKQQFTAHAFNSNGQEITGVIFSWQSSNTAVATIDQNGLATSSSSGTTQITASGRGIQSAPATLTVRDIPRVLTRIDVTPSSATIPTTGAQQFTAHGFDQFGNEIVGLAFTWASTNTSAATVDQTGLATGVASGQSTIKATSGNVTGTATLNVTPPTVIVNEVLADPPGSAATDLQGDANHDGVRSSSDDEFVEFVNSTNGSISIAGWTLRTRATGSTTETTRHTFATGRTLPAGEAIVVFGGGNFDSADPIFHCAQVVKASSGGLSLTNSGLTILLYDSSGNLITQFAYGGSTGLNGGNSQSLTRSPDITGNFVQHSTATGANGKLFSPGTKVDGTAFGNCPSRLTSVTISPSSSSVIINQSTQFTAQAFDQFGQPFNGATITFASDNTNVATVDSVTTDPNTGIATATVTGHNQGTAHITAQATSGTTTVTSQQATLTVNPPTPVLSSVSITPTSATIDAGQTQQYTAQALDQFGQPIGGVTITFSSSNTAVATVDSVSATTSTGSATATVTAHINGSSNITATANDGTKLVASNPATLTVAQVFTPGSVLISEFRTRGPAGASDEFIELYNPTSSTVTIGSLKVRASNSSGTISDRVTITAGTTLGSGCHYLIANTAYTGSVTPNQTYGTGITDDGGIAITQADGTTIIDQVGMSAGSAYKEGTPLAALSTNVNQSYERKPGGALGNGTDTNNNSNDFFLNATSSNPQNLSSGCLDLSTADLSIIQTDSPDPVTTGSNVTYTITVTNNGAGNAQTVVVTDNLPANVTFVSCASTGAGVCGGTGNNRTVNFSSLASGASATITLVATANGAAATTITNTATVSSSTSDPNSSNNSATETTTVQGPVPSLSINDVTQNEGNTGTTTFTFTVSLSSPAQAGGVTFNIATQDGTATVANNDYVARNLTGQTIPAGQQTYTFDVTVNGDTVVEPDETFNVNVTNVSGASIVDGVGLGTIKNDDTANLVISQIYVGGNNSGATYRNDFVEIFNHGTTTVDFSATPYSVQYTSGSSWAKTDLTVGTVAPGHYFLVQESGGTTNGIALPQPDATGTINFTGSSPAKIALVLGTTLLSTSSCPGDDGNPPLNPNLSAIVDFVGYGGTAATSGHCYEGTGPAPLPTNTTADFRKAGGCTDTNDNAADFFASTPFPRNTSSPANTCSTGTAPNLTINDVTVTEGNSGTKTATFTVSLSAPAPATDVTFNIATQDNTATVANNDYVARSLTNQVIPAGQQTYTFDVTINGDTTVEPDETFFVNVTNVTGATVTKGQGVGTISNDDLPSLSINDVSKNEGNTGTTTFTFTVSLSAPAPAPVTFDIATQDNTATVTDNDYVAKSLTAQTIPAGSQTYSFDVTVNGDTNIEPNETFFVNVTNVSGATITKGQGIGTIQNDDSPTLSINDVSMNEGNAGTTTFTFTVSLSQPAPAGGVTFDIATQDGTATVAGNDYVAKSLTGQAITAGNQTYTFDVTVNGDTVAEPDETFFVNLTNVSGATVSKAQGVGTIQNDDTTNLVISQIYPGGGLTNATYTNDFIEIFNRGTTTVDFSVTPYSVQFLSTGGSTWVKTDITTGTMAPGQYFLIQETSGGANGAALPTPDATGTINLTSTTPGKVALLLGTTLLTGNCPGDDGTAPFNPVSNTIVDFVGYGGTASTANHCYEGNGPATLQSGNNTIADLRKNGGCTDTNDNAADFLSATPFPRNSSSPTNSCAAGTPPDLSINDVTVTEGNSGTVTATFTVHLSAPAPSTDMTFDIATQDNTATVANNDYVARSLTNQVIPAGQQNYTFSVTVNGDTTIEPDETFFVNVTNVVGANVTKSQGIGTIKNDDFPTLSINDVSQNEGNSGTTTFTFTVSLSAPAQTGGVTFDIATQDNTATVADNDYAARSLTAQTIPAGQQTYTFDVTVNGDTNIEPNETFFVNVTNVSGATVTKGQGVGTIQNDDSPTLSINDVSMNEGNSGTSAFTFTVTLSQSSNQTVTVDYATANGTATAGSDYQSTSNTLTFNPGDTQKTITVLVNGDTLVEPDETFSVNLTNASGATISDSLGLGTITNDDTPLIVISQVYGGGGNTGAQFKNDFIEIFNRGTATVDLAGWSVQGASATSSSWSVTPLCPTGSCLLAPGKYFLVQEAATNTASCGNAPCGVALPTADATGTINLSATAAKVALVSNTTALTVANPTGANILDLVGYGSTANGFEGTGPAPAPSNTTADFRKSGGCVDTNDNAADFVVSAPNPRNSSSPANDCSTGFRPDITINDVTVTEGDTGTKTVDFTVSLSAASTQTVTVNYATADGTATAGSDYQSTSGMLTFTPGQTTQTITVTINGDTLSEPNETFFVNLTNATNAAILDNQGQGTITDNDPLPSFSINDVAMNEGDSGTTSFVFTVTLSAPSGFTTTVDYATADGTASTANNDYQATSGTLTFNPGETMKQITVLVNGDTTFETNETFFVNLTNAVHASISDNQGQGTITNDDAAPPTPTISINDVSVAEGNSGTTNATFTVKLSISSAQTVTVDYATASAAPANGVATAGTDYQSTSGTLTFTPGVTTQTITVLVNGDKLVEPDETFFVNLTNAVNATISDNQGVGTITNDDTPQLVISQIYPGGGNTSATYKNDFIEIFNRGTTTVDFSVTPYSIQYVGTSGSFGSTSASNLTAINSGTIAPGQYFLVQEASGGAVGATLPTPDATGSINLAASSGKVALVIGTAALTASTCPGDDGTSPFNPNNSTIADFVGYGGTATTTGNCYEGSGPAPFSGTNPNARSTIRTSSCTDTNVNSADFSNPTTAPTARNSATTLAPCP